MQARNILVLGGSGFIGTSVCERLVERATASVQGGSARIIVPTRNPAHASRVQLLPMVEVVRADVHDDAQLQSLIAQADVVIHLIAQLHGSDRAMERTHVALPKRIAEACTKAGVARVIHVSAIGLDAVPLPSRYLRSKAAGERALRDNPNLQCTVLRPSVVFGARDQSTNLFASLQRIAPVMPLASSQALLQPVWVEDVAQAIVACVDLQQSIGQIYECAGPDVMTLADLVRQCGRMAGVQRPILPLPNMLGRLQALTMELLPGDPLLSRDNLDSLKLPSVASPSRQGLSALGIQAASLAQIAPTYLQAQAGVGRMDAWRARARR
jgi:uncharacterized protein YbjT (DUF2867 family)